MELPYIANENVRAGENPDINITVTDNSPVGVRLREAFLSKGKPFILKKVRQYDDLMASGGPAKEELQNKTPPKSTKAAQTVDKNSSLKPAVREEFKRLLIERFNCRASVIYDILMDDNRWKGFSQSNAKISREVGGSFSLFDGAITGVNQTPREVGKNLFSIRSEQYLVMECNGSHVSFPLYTSHLRWCSLVCHTSLADSILLLKALAGLHMSTVCCSARVSIFEIQKY